MKGVCEQGHRSSGDRIRSRNSLRRGRFWYSVRGWSDRGGTWVPQRWWEQPRIDWRLAREQNERAEAAGETYTEETAGTTTATTETETSGSEKGTGEEASLGASGSSGVEWSGAED